jgi:hypothetical protein
MQTDRQDRHYKQQRPTIRDQHEWHKRQEQIDQGKSFCSQTTHASKLKKQEEEERKTKRKKEDEGVNK